MNTPHVPSAPMTRLALGGVVAVIVLNLLLRTFGVLQGSCRVSRVFKLLFSLPAGPSLG
jgi:hypothetical protein